MGRRIFRRTSRGAAGDIAGEQVVMTMSASGAFTVTVTDGTVACMLLAGDRAEIDKGT